MVSSPDGPSEPRKRPATILVVDDDEMVREVTAQALGNADYEVLVADSGAAAMALMVATPPDLVLADVVMPDMDGIELCKRAKATPELAGTFFVMLSGERRSSSDQAHGLEIGADGYIARPISNRELVARVEALLRIKRAEDERDRVIAELRIALAQIKTLSGLLPICMHCNKIRDDSGYWNRVEQFIEERTEAEFTHGLCPDCLEKHYPR